jgi:hypothetical protein
MCPGLVKNSIRIHSGSHEIMAKEEEEYESLPSEQRKYKTGQEFCLLQFTSAAKETKERE